MSSSSSDDEYLALAAFALSKSKRRHKKWVRDFLKERDEYKMVLDLAICDREMYFRYMRMTPDQKELLLSLVAPYITKLSTNDSEPIPPEQKKIISRKRYSFKFFSARAVLFLPASDPLKESYRIRFLLN